MENTAKNFALQLGSLISLYVSITALIVLLFGVITIQFPDTANGHWEYESASSGIRFSIALLVVFFPTYLVLTRMVNTIRRKEQGVYLMLTKWLIYLSLLLGGSIILGDLVALINTFLNGALTTRFLLQALVFLAVVGSAFVYYLFDVRGYWQQHEKHSVRYGLGALVVVVVAIVVGFMHISAPAEVREMRIDDKQVNDLMTIQSHIESYLYTYGTLPASISDAFGGIAIPAAPEGRGAYTYTATGATMYEICAEFAFESVAGAEPYYYDVSMKPAFSWEHGAGEWCYTRTAQLSPETLIR